ncbi:helitron helicase-like domain-containing protein [Kineosporia rhizophila]|uniref:helitron helicase-like domain-containing protein n=1 Tax=Kineosporia rhizophila TaxID=84633 RepID=UPI001E3AE0E6|nr:helitron helicase-like domain-containing protein [Kineosporia rhizophila]MCE0536987.1 helitron helicase-like domain-containing protein [Kineosporia rhizophila]
MTTTPTPPATASENLGNPMQPSGASISNLTRNSRAERARMPVALHVAEDVAIANGVCVRPITQRVTDTLTGEVTLVDVPCGATLESKCPTCAQRARRLRMHQCRVGWHAESDPIPDEDPSTSAQQDLVAARADVTAVRDDYLARGDHDVAEAASETLDVIDAELAEMGVRGPLERGKPETARRKRSTRRRQDAPDLPKRTMAKTTVGQTFPGKDGKVYRPSMFVTVTLPGYGRVDGNGVPLDPGRYDYRRAARDAIHFPKLLDRLVQNLRRVAGYDVQYFATVEPQKRLAPHAHIAVRGTIPRALVRQVIAATYHQVWWPQADTPVYVREDELPVWDEDADTPDAAGNSAGESVGYLDPTTAAVLPTWDEALDDLDTVDDLEPQHVVRFGIQSDIQGLLAGSPDADRRVGYLAKYLTKSMGTAHGEDENPAVKAHVDRLVHALRYEPCSPRCANWLRYGIQPKDARPGLIPGSCKAKAHRREHLGYGGRRVLVSRKWSGKTLTDHRHERRAFVLALLGVDPDSADATRGDKTADRYVWEPVNPNELPPLSTRLLHAISQRQTWRAAYEAAKEGNGPPPTVAA